MKYIKTLAVVGLCVFLGACASTYTHQTVAVAQTKLDRSGSVLVAVPRDGSYGDKTYAGSGVDTAEAIRAAFDRFSNDVELATDCSQIDCLTTSQKPFTYYVLPAILHWEDRATEWSGKKDKISIKITVYDNRRKVVASQIISGKSKSLTFGGDHPQDLLAAPITAYVQSLY